MLSVSYLKFYTYSPVTVWRVMVLTAAVLVLGVGSPSVLSTLPRCWPGPQLSVRIQGQVTHWHNKYRSVQELRSISMLFKILKLR